MPFDIQVCTLCSKRCEVMRVKETNTKGNAGRLYVSCESYPRQGSKPAISHALFLRWLSADYVDPYSTPEHPSPQSSQAEYLPTDVIKPHCTYPDCTNKRPPAKTCSNQMCAPHCRCTGNCFAPGHGALVVPDDTLLEDEEDDDGTRASTSRTDTNRPPPSQPQRPPPTPQTSFRPPPSQPRRPPPAAQPAPSAQTQRSSKSSRQPAPSHTPQLYTDIQQTQQAAEASRRILQNTTRTNTTRAEHVVRVFAYLHDGIPPMPFDVDAETFPTFCLSDKVLESVGLTDDGEAVETVEKYDTMDLFWVRVKRVHVLRIEGQEKRVYLRVVGVTQCEGFVEHLKTSRALPNIREDLAGERAAVRRQHDASASSSKAAWFTQPSSPRRQPPPVPTVSSVRKSNASTVSSVRKSNASASTSRTFPPSPPPPTTKMIKRERTSPDVESAKRKKKNPLRVDDSEEEKEVIEIEDSSIEEVQLPRVKIEPDIEIKVEPLVESSSHIDLSLSSDDETPRFPSSYFVVDVVKGFKKCQKSQRAGRKVIDIFQAHFRHAAFHSTTFYTSRKRWRQVDHSIREKCIKAGRTDEGTWNEFLRLRRKEGYTDEMLGDDDGSEVENIRRSKGKGKQQDS